MKIYWKDIEDSKRQWCGMAAHVSRAPKPGFHLQTGTNCRIKLVNRNGTLFWATQIKDFGGVWLIKSFADIAVEQMLIGPIQSVDIEERKNLHDAEWLKSWCRFFIKQLEQSDVGIFYDGLWLLGPCLSDANKKDWESKSSLTVIWVLLLFIKLRMHYFQIISN